MVRRKTRRGKVIMRHIACLALLFYTLSAHSQNFLVDEDLRLDWTFYDSEQKTLLPFLSNNSSNPNAIHLSCNLNRGKSAFLRLEIPSSTSLLIDDRHMEYFADQTVRYLSLDSLKKIYKTDKIEITLFCKERFFEPVKAEAGYKFSRQEIDANVNPMHLRNPDWDAEFFKVVLLIVFSFFVVLYSIFPAELLEFYSIGSVASYRYTDTQLAKFRSVTQIQTLIIMFQAALMAAVMLITMRYFHNPLGNVFFLRMNPVLGWFVLFLMTLVSLWLKYFLILFFSLLFDVFERANLYFIEYLRITLLFYSIIFAVLSYSFINYQHTVPVLIGTLSSVVFGFYFLRLVILYFKLHTVISINNLHLFSYICATELVPIVIGLNFFLR